MPQGTDPITTDPISTDPGSGTSSWSSGFSSSAIKNLLKSYGMDTGKWWRNDMTKNLSALMLPRMAGQVSFSNTLEPLRQNGIMSSLTALNPANIQATVDNVSRVNNANAVETARLTGLGLAGSGLGSGAIDGARVAAVNDAASRNNQYVQSVFSPEGISRAWQNYLATVNGGQKLDFNDLIGLMNGQIAQSSGDGWSSLIGNLVGAGATAYAGSKK